VLNIKMVCPQRVIRHHPSGVTVTKPVITGFLFGLGMFVATSQLPTVFGVKGDSGQFLHRLSESATSATRTS
jgi:MFS superfamily sulfate permease-like transporter